MKIGVIGTRGFPEIQGGLETHVWELYTRIAELGDNSITVYRRTPYLNQSNKHKKFRNIRFVDIPVPKSKYFEAFIHSLMASVHALFQRYDVVHFHNTGPGFFTPVFRLISTKVVFTYHNKSYTQKKWNKFAKWFLRVSEKVSLTNSDYVIFISRVLEKEMVEKYKLKHHSLILNGVNLPVKSSSTDYIESLKLERHKYIISVGRYLEEKGFDYLIRAFRKADLKEYKLVIVGDADYPTDYSIKFKSYACENCVLLTGFIKGDKLNQIFTNAKLFIMASFEEGLPIALLEAMSYDLDLLASNIPAHLQLGLNPDDYFEVGNEDVLCEMIKNKIKNPGKHSNAKILSEKFNWDSIASNTYEVYKSLAD